MRRRIVRHLVATASFMVLVVPGAGAAPAPVLTQQSVKCMGQIWDEAAFAKCKPQLTLAAVQKFATAAAPQFLPKSFTTTQDLGGGRIYTETFTSEFASVSSCQRRFPRSYESGCSLMTRDTSSWSESGSGQHGGGCGIESLVALGVEAGPSRGFRGDPHESRVFHLSKPKPFSVIVSAVGPNPRPPLPTPC